MFLFYHTDQTSANRSFYKGQLFENLLARYLDVLGYEVTIRVKHASLEYDLEGVHKADKRSVLGEAKAYDRPISGDVLSAFVGKLLPLGLARGALSGLFLSTSALTAEAADYYASLSGFPIYAYTGDALLRQVRNALHLPQPEPLERQVEERGLKPLGAHILTTNVGIFAIILASAPDSAVPSSFALYAEDGTVLSDVEFLQKVADAVPELQQLSPIRFDAVKPAVQTVRSIPLGLAVGQQWADFRLPARPDQFVGRRELSKEILRMIETDSETRIIQIKSRSGVGKSSLLAYVADSLNKKGHRVEIHDARDVKSIFDLFSVIQRFCKEPRLATDFQSAEKQLNKLANSISPGCRAVFMVDQFESVFTSPELFTGYETLALSAMRTSGNLAFVFARKNDQLTTFDDTRISLERLNQFSKPYVLQDFTVEEAAELIDHISQTATKKISKEVRAFVLEFAQGFPWLIKRTMAHILRLVGDGVVQRELFAAGLRLDELFDEELEGLDEVERDYLVRLAHRLPANFQQLQQEFDEDPMLPRVLDKLTRSRLLRLAGSTYDTYNDVFKEYLVYQRVPEFRQVHIHRLWPRTVLQHFHKLLAGSSWSTEEMEEEFDLSRGSLFNIIRELRALGLLKKDGSRWQIPPVVQDICKRGALGDYVRRALLENAVVADLLAFVAREGHIRICELPAYLQKQFAFVEAAASTWRTYARVLLAWVTSLRILTVQNDRLVLSGQKRAEVIEELGNLSDISGTTLQRRRDIFLPQTQWCRVCEAAQQLLLGAPARGLSTKALSDLRGLGLMTGNKLQIASVHELEGTARRTLSAEPYSRVWAAAKQAIPVSPEVRSLTRGSTDETVRWRTKVLLNWGKELGLIPGKRYRYF